MPPKRKSAGRDSGGIGGKMKKIAQNHEIEKLMDISTKLRIHSIEMTQAAKAGHPTTCCSIAEIMAALFFDTEGMHYDPANPQDLMNDRLILSKGHAAPILYAAWAEAGLGDKAELLNLRKITSDLEGHPTPKLPFVDVATGSLGQGICNAVGMSYSAKNWDKTACHFWCIMGDGEIAEGSCWEAFQIASHYNLDNLTIIIDQNRLQQSIEALHGHQTEKLKKKLEAFGLHTIVVDGHSLPHIIDGFERARRIKNKPTVIIAKTFKGSDCGEEVENQLGWHGKVIDGEIGENALKALKERIKDEEVKMIPTPYEGEPKMKEELGDLSLGDLEFMVGDKINTREAYGKAITALGDSNDKIVVFDADMRTSTMTHHFLTAHPDRFLECYIAEQNMAGMATGAQCRGLVPFVNTYAVFHTRAYDFYRMAAISRANIKIVGSHCGVTVGVDGESHMGLEDIAMMSPLPNCIILYPSDATSAAQATMLAAKYKGMVYMRTTRVATPVVYPKDEVFEVGKAKIFKKEGCAKPVATVIGAGITFDQALKAQKEVDITVIDLFSVKPLDKLAIMTAAKESNNLIITVEDHYPEGGIYSAVASALAPEKGFEIHRISIEEIPRSGQPEELIEMFGISTKKIVEKVIKLTTKMTGEKKELNDEIEKLEGIIADQTMLNKILDDVFEIYDVDKNKVIDQNELKVFMINFSAKAKIHMPNDQEVKKAFEDADANKNGVLEKEEMPKIVKDMLAAAILNAKIRLAQLSK